MKKKVKKLFTLLLCSTMILSPMTSFAEGDNPEVSPPTESCEQAPEVESKQAPVAESKREAKAPEVKEEVKEVETDKKADPVASDATSESVSTDKETEEVSSDESVAFVVVDEEGEPIVASESSELEVAEVTDEMIDSEVADEEIKMPAFGQSVEVDGVTVKVTAEKGIFPEGAELKVRSATKAEEKKADALVKKARDTERNIAASYAFDISVVDKDGKEIQPKDGSKVNVAFATDEMSEELLTPEVFHIDESGLRDKAESLTVKETATEAIAETDGFSTYYLVFSQGVIEYDMDNASESLESLMSALGLHGQLWNVESGDSSRLVVEGPSETRSDASEWKITSLQNISDEDPVELVISLYNRPDYRITVTSTGVIPDSSASHTIKLLHIDGHEVTESNPAQHSEALEVYVTGFTKEEQEALNYNYKCTQISPNGSTSSGTGWKVFSDLSDQIQSSKIYSTRGTASASNKTGFKYLTMCGYTGDAESVKANGPATFTITVKKGSSSGPIVAQKTISFNVVYDNSDSSENSLQKSLNDAARNLKPVVLYKGTTSENLKDVLNNVGILHIKGCTQSPAPTLTASIDAADSDKISYDTNTSKVTGGNTPGYSKVTFTLNKEGCTFHKGQSGTIDFDIYVLDTPVASLDKDELTITSLNPWCKYQIVDITDGGNTVIETYSPSLIDPNADDPDKAIDPDNNTITVSNLTQGHTYKIIEINNINFSNQQGQATSNTVKIDGDDEATVIEVSHVHSFTYTVSGATITAICTDTECPAADKGEVKLTLNVSDATFTENTPVTAILANTAAFNATTGHTVSDADIEYYQGSTLLNSAPINAGSYTAKITVEGETATADFTISPIAETAPAKPTIETPAASAPGATQSLTVTNAENGVDYVVKLNGEEVKTVRATADGNLVIDGLAPGTEYTITAVRPARDGNYSATSSASSDPATTPKQKLDTPATPITTVTVDSITITNPEAGVEYTVNGVTKTLTDGETSIVFDGLDMNTEYPVTAIAKGNNTTTVNSEEVSINVTTANHVHDWSFTTNGSTMTATCNGAGTCSADGTQTLTLAAPADSVYGDANTKTATVENKNNFETNTGAVVGTVTYQKKNGSNWEATGTPEGAGTYRALVDITANSSPLALESAEFTIAKADQTTPDAPNATAQAHNSIVVQNAVVGAVYQVVNTASQVIAEVTATENGQLTITDDSILGGEIYTIKAQKPEDENHNASGISSGTVNTPQKEFDGELTDNQKPFAKTNLVYNGQEQALVTAPSELPEGYTKVQYKVGDGEWSDTIPADTDADTYTVQVQYVDENGHNATFSGSPIDVTIARKTVTVDWPADPEYDGTEKNIAPTLNGIVEGETVGTDVSGNIGTNAGNYTATITTMTGDAAKNYAFDGNAELVHQWEITKNNNTTKDTLTNTQKATAKTNLVYNGSEQSLVEGPSEALPEGYTIKYSLDGENWSTDIPAGQDATGYTVKVKYEGDNNHATFMGDDIEASIAKKSVTVDWPGNPEYDGTLKTIEPTLVGIIDGETVGTDVNGNSATNYGNYTATITTMTDEDAKNYEFADNAELEHAWSVTKTKEAMPQAPDASAPEHDTIVISNAIEGAVYQIINSANEVIAEAIATADGTLTINDEDIEGGEEYTVKTYMPASDENHNDSDPATSTVKTPYNKDDLTNAEKPSANGTLVPYNGENQTILTAPSSLPENYTKVQYSLDGQNWSDEIPAEKDAETYTVHTKYVGENGYPDFMGDDVTATIAKAQVTVTWPADLKYNGATQTLTPSLNGIVDGETVGFDITGNTGKDADSYTAVITDMTGADAANYVFADNAELEHDWSIAKNDETTKDDLTDGQKPIAKTGLTYNADFQALVDAPASLPEGFTKVQYKVGDGEWGDEIPTGKDAVTYKVQVRYVGDANHKTFEGDPISVAIAPFELTATWPADPEYTGSEQIIEPVLNGVFSGDSVIPTVADNKGTNAGDNGTAEITALSSSNYVIKDSDRTHDWMIKKGTPDAPAAPNASATAYNTITVQDAVSGTVYEVLDKTGNVIASATATSDTLAITDDDIIGGTDYTVRAYIPSDENHNQSPYSTETPVTTPKQDQAAPADAPTVKSTTDTSIVVGPTVAGQEYTIAQKGQAPDWTTSQTSANGEDITFASLDPATEYTVFTRIPGNDTKNPSAPKSANATTRATAPSEDNIKTTATTLTIENPENSTLYTVYDEGGNVIAKVQKDKDGTVSTIETADGVTVETKDNGDIVVGNLEQDKTYTVTATKLDDNDEPINGTESAPTPAATGLHVHAWTYTSSGAKATATCEGEGTCSIAGRKVEMEIKTAKASYTYGEALSISVDNEAAFEATGITVEEIEYYGPTGKLDNAPSNVGEYTAKVKVGDDMYPEVSFAIVKQKEETPDESIKPIAEANGYDKVNVTNPEKGYTYELRASNGDIVATSMYRNDGTVSGPATIVDGKLVFTNATPNTEYTVRMFKPASDENHSDSDKLVSNAVTTKKQPEEAPSAPSATATSKNTATIAGADTGNKYVLKAGNDEIVITFDNSGNPVVAPSGVTATYENGTLTVAGLTPDTEYQVTAYKEPTDENHRESEASPATPIKTAKAAPTTPAQKDMVGAAGTDGSIDGVDSTMEYLDPATGEWTEITGTEITGLVPGNYDIRYKADGNQPASGVKTVTVESKTSEREPVNASDIATETETRKIAVTAPVKSDEDSTVYEYSLDGTNWQTSPVFTQIKDGNTMSNLQPGTTYQLYVRKAETDTQMATTPTMVEVTTKPEAPDVSDIETTPTTLTIHDPESSTKYEVKDENDNIIATIKIDSNGDVISSTSTSPAVVTIKDNGDIVVSELEQEKTYTIYATKIDDNGTDISGQSEGTPAETAAHAHDWQRAVVDGYKFVAVCTGEGECSVDTQSAELVASNKIYDGQPYAATLNTTDDLAECGATVGTIEYYRGNEKLTSAPVEKGQYTAKVTVTAGGTDYVLEKAFSITKNGDNAFPENAAPVIEDWTYGSAANAPSIPDNMKPAHGEVKFVYSSSENGNFTENAPSTAGTWYVKAVVEDTEDYNACESGVTSFKINPKPINAGDLEWTGGELTYTGDPQSVTARVVSGMVGGDTATITVSCTPQTNASSYTANATAISNPNYILSDSAKADHNWSIVKATDNAFDNNAKPSIQGWTYGETPNAPSGPSAKYGNDTVHYVYSNASDGTYTDTVPTDAGDWYVKAVIDGNANYNTATSEPQKFTIAKKAVTLFWPADPTYDGTEKEMKPSIEGLVSGDSVSPVMDGDYKATDVKTFGSYTAKVTELSGAKADNYEIDGSKNHSWNISKGTVDAPTGVSTKPDSKVNGVDNGSITGVNDTMEYSSNGGNTWTKVPAGSTSIEGLSAGDYKVRYAETSNTLASEAVDVTVAEKGDQTAPTTAPNADEVTTNSITIDPTQPGYEYVVVPKGEDPDWDDAVKSERGEAITFGNLEPGKDYEVISRKAETEDSDASEPGPAEDVTTTPNPPSDMSATPTSITIEDPEESTQYKVYNEDGDVVATVNIDKDGNPMEPVPDNVTVKNNGDIVVSGLEPDKDYTVTATKIDENGTPKSEESAPSEKVTTPVQTPEDTPAKPAATANTDGTVTVDVPQNNEGTKYVITDEDGNETVIEVKENGTIVNPSGDIQGTINDEGDLVISGLDPNSVYTISAVKTPTDADHSESQPSPAAVVRTAKDAPTTPDMKDKVGEAGNDGSIDGVDNTMEYFDPDDNRWKPVTGDTIENLKPGDYQVRYAEVPASGNTPAQPASEAKTVTVELKASDQTPPADNIKTDSTTNTVSVVDPNPAYEYSIDGENWVKPTAGQNVTFDKDKDGKALLPATAYEIKVRKQETADSMPSAPVTVSVNTKPEKTDEDDIDKDPNSIVVNPTTPGVEYTVVPKGKSPLTEDDWADSQTSQNGEPLTFGGLEPGTEYEVVTRTPAVTDDDGNVITPASDESERTPVFTQAEKPNDEGKNARSATVNDEPDQEYSIDGRNWIKPVDGETLTMGDGMTVTLENGKLTFGNLQPNTRYEILTRKDGNNETVSEPRVITTEPTGQYVPETKFDSDVPDATVKGLDKDLAEALCSADEKERVLDGENAYLILEMTNIDNTVADTEKNIAENFVSKIKSGTVVSEYIDISVYTKVGNSNRTQIHETGKALNFTMEVPENIRAKNRIFYLIKIHNGQPSLADQTTGNKFEFSSSEFSTYVIAYNDPTQESEASQTVDKDKTNKDESSKTSGNGSKSPKTGDEGLVGWIVLMALAGTAIIAISRRKKTEE